MRIVVHAGREDQVPVNLCDETHTYVRETHDGGIYILGAIPRSKSKRTWVYRWTKVCPDKMVFLPEPSYPFESALTDGLFDGAVVTEHANCATAFQYIADKLREMGD